MAASGFLCVLFGSVFLFAAVSCQRPKIVNAIYPDVQRIGGTARLNCTVARLQENTVEWSFDGENGKEVISRNEEVIISYRETKDQKDNYEIVRKDQPELSRTTFTLVIHRLLSTQSGDYMCTVVVNNEDYRLWDRKVGHLTVQYSPSIQPGSTDTVKQLEEGETTNITCNALGVPAPNITWARSDGKLLPTGKALHRGRTLPIKYAEVKYAGIYRCVADNSIKPPATSLTQVYVFQAPVVRVLQKSVGQFPNARLTAKLDCIVQGYPPPEVYWMYYTDTTENVVTNDVTFETSKQTMDNMNLYSGEEWYTLMISNVMDNHFRDYYCVARNNKGRGMATVTLFRTTDCQGPLCYSIEPDNRNGVTTQAKSSPLFVFIGVIALCVINMVALH